MWLVSEASSVVKENEYIADHLQPLNDHEARMYSLEQLQQLALLFFNRSDARRRLDINDCETLDARQRIQQLESWRDQWE